MFLLFLFGGMFLASSRSFSGVYTLENSRLEAKNGGGWKHGFAFQLGDL